MSEGGDSPPQKKSSSPQHPPQEEEEEATAVIQTPTPRVGSGKGGGEKISRDLRMGKQGLSSGENPRLSSRRRRGRWEGENNKGGLTTNMHFSRKKKKDKRGIIFVQQLPARFVVKGLF